MRAVVTFESLTGNTRRAAAMIAERLEARGVDVLDVCPTADLDHSKLQAADLVVIGSWVKGHFIIGMKPAMQGKLDKLPSMAGKKAVVFCTYALNPGTTLDAMTASAERLGAEVVGGMALNRRKLAAHADELVDRLMGVLTA
jgi:flavodoxin